MLDFDRYCLVVLFGGAAGMAAGEVIRRSISPGMPVTVAVPPAGGVEFLGAVGPAAVALNRWWQAEVGQRDLPVFLAMDEPDLPAWIPGTHGAWFVGIADDHRAEVYQGIEPPVFTITGAAPSGVVEQAMGALTAESALTWDKPIPRLASSAPAPGRPAPRGAADVPAWQRLRALAESAPTRLGRWGNGLAARVGRDEVADTKNLGAIVNANRPMLVAFGSRKGGVGKTTHAAAVAATIGESFDGMPDTAALVDANVTNPDSWALHPPPGAATVRTIVARLAAGEDPPPEQYSATPRLAIYPESRLGEELYTRAEIDLVAHHLRRRHSFSAVDLPNALPSLTSGGAPAVAAAWLDVCDAVVLPFSADPRARQGLLEYIDELAADANLRRLPVVAAYIVSSNREIAADQQVLADLDAVRRRRATIVEIPDSENALLALLQDRPITQASPALRRAYAHLARVVVESVVRARQLA